MIGKEFEERMLTTDQISKWLGIAPRTVCTWAEVNEIPAVKVGRQWRFRRSEIILWLQQSQVNQPQARTHATLALSRDPASES